MSPQPPTRTPEQINEARQVANETRAERKAIKARIKSGELSIYDVFARGAHGRTDEIGEHARLYGGLRVGEALNAVPSVGKVKVAKALAAGGITNPHAHLDTLSAAERDNVLAWLDEHVGS